MQNLGDIPQAVIGSYLVTLDDNGRIKTDESRGVTNVKYNPLGLPSSITMGSEFTIINSYLSDGRLINETMREYYLAQVKRYDRVTGDTIIVYMPRLVSSVSRRHLGDFIIEAGKNPRSYYDWGYVEWLSDSTVQYYYYERDHQGSVRTVRDASFGVVQSTAYTVSGLPMTRIYSGVGDHHLHTGKPWQDTGGLAWYNNRARWYDPITMRFLTPDPLADKYHDISPWAWCGNNPLRYSDPSGKSIFLNSRDELVLIQSIVKPDERNFINSMSDGFIDMEMMRLGADLLDNVSENYKCLFEIVKDKRVVEFSLSEEKTAKLIDGTLVTKEDIPFQFNDVIPLDEYESDYSLAGSIGWTFAPLSHKWTRNDLNNRNQNPLNKQFYSTSDNYQIQINAFGLPFNSTYLQLVETAAHELLGHLYLMFIGADSLHGSSFLVDPFILNRSNEAVRYYETIP